MEKMTINIPSSLKACSVNIANGGKTIEIYCKTVKKDILQKDDFYVDYLTVEASQLSLNDRFMQYMPRTAKQKVLYNEIENLIKTGGMKDFLIPDVLPSVDIFDNIVFNGERCGTGYSAEWWQDKAKEVAPERNSRMATLKHYIALLAVVLKFLTEEQAFSVSKAWKDICDNPSWFCEKAKDGGLDPNAGKWKMGKFYNILRHCKFVLDQSNNGYMLVGGNATIQYKNALATFLNVSQTCVNRRNNYATALIVMDK